MTAFWVIGIGLSVSMLAAVIWWIVSNWRDGDR